jgi:hypothetical protein
VQSEADHRRAQDDAGWVDCRCLHRLLRHVDLVLPDVSLHGGEHAPHAGERFNRLEQLAVCPLAALAVVLPLPKRHSSLQLTRVLIIGIIGRQLTKRYPLGEQPLKRGRILL